MIVSNRTVDGYRVQPQGKFISSRSPACRVEARQNGTRQLLEREQLVRRGNLGESAFIATSFRPAAARLMHRKPLTMHEFWVKKV